MTKNEKVGKEKKYMTAGRDERFPGKKKKKKRFSEIKR